MWESSLPSLPSLLSPQSCEKISRMVNFDSLASSEDLKFVIYQASSPCLAALMCEWAWVGSSVDVESISVWQWWISCCVDMSLYYLSRHPLPLGSLVLLSTLMGGVEGTQLSQSTLSLYVKGHVAWTLILGMCTDCWMDCWVTVDWIVWT